MLLEGFSHIVMLERCSIKKIEGLYVLGKPDMTVIAFGSREVDIYKVNDVMTTQGWSLNALHKPSR
jgi:sphinganine-1-phosphate aldolase